MYRFILCLCLLFPLAANAAGTCASATSWSQGDISSSNPYLYFPGFPGASQTAVPILTAEASCPNSVYTGSSRGQIEISQDAAILNYMFQSYCQGDALRGALVHTDNLALSNTDAIRKCGQNYRSYVAPPSSCSAMPSVPTVLCFDTFSQAEPLVKPLCVCSSCGDGELDTSEECDDGNDISADGCSPQCTHEAGTPCTNTITYSMSSFSSPSSILVSAYVSSTCPPPTLPFASGFAAAKAMFGFSTQPGSTVTRGDSPLCDAILGGSIINQAVIFAKSGVGAFVYSNDGFTVCNENRVSLFPLSATLNQVSFTASRVLCQTGNTDSGLLDKCGVCTGDGTTCCGNSVVNTGEQCDDGNVASGDGCSASCEIESGACATPAPFSSFQGPLFASSNDILSTVCGQDSFYNLTSATGLFSEIGGSLGAVGTSMAACSHLLSLGDSSVAKIVLSSDSATATLIEYLSPTECNTYAIAATSILSTANIYAMCLPSTGTFDGCGVCGGTGSTCCGDGILQSGEACDDGNTAGGDGCNPICQIEPTHDCVQNTVYPRPFTVCIPKAGNGALDAGEACDDNNVVDGDGCSSTGQIETGYICPTPGSPCAPDCGDNVVTGAEVCDDGNTTPGDGCSATCEVETGYQCFGNPSSCELLCGNSIVGAGEECDDRNNIAGDGCSPTCTVEPGFVCTGSPSFCSRCGNGAIDASEACDDGNNTPGDGCNFFCVVEPGYVCPTPGSPCTPVCGDSSIFGSETCDDGNTTPSDGCSATCQVETGFECDSETRECQTLLGKLCGTISYGTQVSTYSAGDLQGHIVDTCGRYDSIATTYSPTISVGPGNPECDYVLARSIAENSPASIITAANSLVITRILAFEGECSLIPNTVNSATGGAVSVICATSPTSLDRCGVCDGNGLSCCGDSIAQETEPCDDGNAAPSDGCSASCEIESGYTCTGTPSSCSLLCGNGALDAGEACDDGNGASGDGCSPSCQIESGYDCNGTPSVCTRCGNGQDDPGEDCDDGNTAPGDGCSPTCQVESGFSCTGAPSSCTPLCGNSVVDSGEACDDGNTAPGDGCSPACQVETGFDCTGAPSVCTECGNGVVDPGEACDDGNRVSADGCSSTCQVETGYQCSGAPSSCTQCGNGAVNPGEACDDGNAAPGDGCSATCEVEPGFVCTGSPSSCSRCGNGALDAGEVCDDGNTASGDGCSNCAVDSGFTCTGFPSSCTQCGNGAVDPGEACDDGNAVSGDGCSAACEVEIGFVCPLPNTPCVTACGNGMINTGETCDDGGLGAGDGCSPTCQVEPGFGCSGSPSECCYSNAPGVACSGQGTCNHGVNTCVCTPPFASFDCATTDLCGDGVVSGRETCDDGNNEDGDGCSFRCLVESGYLCPSPNAACVPGM